MVGRVKTRLEKRSQDHDQYLDGWTNLEQKGKECDSHFLIVNYSVAVEGRSKPAATVIDDRVQYFGVPSAGKDLSGVAVNY